MMKLKFCIALLLCSAYANAQHATSYDTTSKHGVPAHNSIIKQVIEKDTLRVLWYWRMPEDDMVIQEYYEVNYLIKRSGYFILGFTYTYSKRIDDVDLKYWPKKSK